MKPITLPLLAVIALLPLAAGLDASAADCTISVYQGKRLYEWDGPHVARYQSSRFLTVEGVVPLPVLALLAAGML